jgi:hypothetical protein
MTIESKTPHGHVSSSSVAPTIRAYLARYGEPRAMAHFGLSRIAIVRAAAGLAVQAGTMRLLQDGLARAAEAEQGGAK